MPRECRPLKSLRPSTPSSTASPSITNDVFRLRSAASAISGNRRPVVAIAGEQAHAFALALDDQAIAVVLDFVDPFRPVRDLGPRVGMQGSNATVRMVA